MSGHENNLKIDADLPHFLLKCNTGDPWQTEIAPITSPMFQLFMFFMITDPKTITKKRWSQVLVAVLVAVMETFLRLVFKDRYSLYHCLFIVGPLTNLVQIYTDRRHAKVGPAQRGSTTAPVAPAANFQPTEAGSPVVDGIKAGTPNAATPPTVGLPTSSRL